MFPLLRTKEAACLICAIAIMMAVVAFAGVLAVGLFVQ